MELPLVVNVSLSSRSYTLEVNVKHKQTKTTQQQIQGHLKKVDVSRFPVVSNEATKELNSVAENKHSQNTPCATKQ